MDSVRIGYADRTRRVFHAAASLYYMARICGSAHDKTRYGSAVSLYSGLSKHVDACAEIEREAGLEDCLADFVKEFTRDMIDADYGILSGEEMFERLQAQDLARKTGSAGGRCIECGRGCRLELYQQPDGSIAWDARLRR